MAKLNVKQLVSVVGNDGSSQSGAAVRFVKNENPGCEIVGVQRATGRRDRTGAPVYEVEYLIDEEEND